MPSDHSSNNCLPVNSKIDFSDMRWFGSFMENLKDERAKQVILILIYYGSDPEVIRELLGKECILPLQDSEEIKKKTHPNFLRSFRVSSLPD